MFKYQLITPGKFYGNVQLASGISNIRYGGQEHPIIFQGMTATCQKHPLDKISQNAGFLNLGGGTRPYCHKLQYTWGKFFQKTENNPPDNNLFDESLIDSRPDLMKLHSFLYYQIAEILANKYNLKKQKLFLAIKSKPVPSLELIESVIKKEETDCQEKIDYPDIYKIFNLYAKDALDLYHYTLSPHNRANTICDLPAPITRQQQKNILDISPEFDILSMLEDPTLRTPLLQRPLSKDELQIINLGCVSLNLDKRRATHQIPNDIDDLLNWSKNSIKLLSKLSDYLSSPKTGLPYTHRDIHTTFNKWENHALRYTKNQGVHCVTHELCIVSQNIESNSDLFARINGEVNSQFTIPTNELPEFFPNRLIFEINTLYKTWAILPHDWGLSEQLAKWQGLPVNPIDLLDYLKSDMTPEEIIFWNSFGIFKVDEIKLAIKLQEHFKQDNIALPLSHIGHIATHLSSPTSYSSSENLDIKLYQALKAKIPLRASTSWRPGLERTDNLTDLYGGQSYINTVTSRQIRKEAQAWQDALHPSLGI